MPKHLKSWFKGGEGTVVGDPFYAQGTSTSSSSSELSCQCLLLVGPWPVTIRGRGKREQPPLFAELALGPALAAAPPSLRVVDVGRLLERQPDLHAVKTELLLQVFGDVPVRGMSHIRAEIGAPTHT